MAAVLVFSRTVVYPVLDAFLLYFPNARFLTRAFIVCQIDRQRQSLLEAIFDCLAPRQIAGEGVPWAILRI